MRLRYNYEKKWHTNDFDPNIFNLNWKKKESTDFTIK